MSKAESKTTSQTQGGCFVVLSEYGRFWDGQEWVREWERARQFSGPFDPSAECERLVHELRRSLGVGCNVAYIPRPKVARFELPRPEIVRKTAVPPNGDDLHISPVAAP